jgi:hypothetical protein
MQQLMRRSSVGNQDIKDNITMFVNSVSSSSKNLPKIWFFDKDNIDDFKLKDSGNSRIVLLSSTDSTYNKIVNAKNAHGICSARITWPVIIKEIIAKCGNERKYYFVTTSNDLAKITQFLVYYCFGVVMKYGISYEDVLSQSSNMKFEIKQFNTTDKVSLSVFDVKKAKQVYYDADRKKNTFLIIMVSDGYLQYQFTEGKNSDSIIVYKSKPFNAELDNHQLDLISKINNFLREKESVYWLIDNPAEEIDLKLI